MVTRRLVALLAAVTALTVVPATADPVDPCTAFAVPPRQEDRATRGEGGLVCTGPPRASMTVSVCVEAFAYFAGWLGLGCQDTTVTGSANLVVGSVTVCPDRDFPLMRTSVTGTTNFGETAYAESVLTTAFCIL